METILFIITIVIGGVLLYSIISFIASIAVWKTSLYSTAPRISYDTFIKWYKVTPEERWDLNDTYVKFYTKHLYFNEYDNPIYIEFKSYSDVLKYKKLRKKWGMMEKEIKKQENTALLLKCVQEEIVNFEKENQAEMLRLLKQEEE